MSNQSLITQTLQATLTERLAGLAVSSSHLPLKPSAKGRYLIEQIHIDAVDDDDFSNPHIKFKATVTLVTKTKKTRSSVVLRDFDDLPPISFKNQKS